MASKNQQTESEELFPESHETYSPRASWPPAAEGRQWGGRAAVPWVRRCSLTCVGGRHDVMRWRGGVGRGIPRNERIVDRIQHSGPLRAWVVESPPGALVPHVPCPLVRGDAMRCGAVVVVVLGQPAPTASAHSWRPACVLLFMAQQVPGQSRVTLRLAAISERRSPKASGRPGLSLLGRCLIAGSVGLGSTTNDARPTGDRIGVFHSLCVQPCCRTYLRRTSEIWQRIGRRYR